MSFSVMSKVLDLAVDANEKLLLIVLSDYCNRDGGGVRPSVATMAARSSMSERTTQRTLRSLEAKGILVRVSNPTRWSPTEYRIDIFAGGELSIVRGAKSARLGVPNRGARLAPDTKEETRTETPLTPAANAAGERSLNPRERGDNPRARVRLEKRRTGAATYGRSRASTTEAEAMADFERAYPEDRDCVEIAVAAWREAQPERLVDAAL